MKPAAVDTAEFNDQRALLHRDAGSPGSGAVRYAAAMYFFGKRLMPADMLEIYRRCCKFDGEDPIDLARFEGVDIPPIARPTTTAQTA